MRSNLKREFKGDCSILNFAPWNQLPYHIIDDIYEEIHHMRMTDVNREFKKKIAYGGSFVFRKYDVYSKFYNFRGLSSTDTYFDNRDWSFTQEDGWMSYPLPKYYWFSSGKVDLRGFR